MELPKFVQIEPVGQCNLKCRMCPIQFRQDGARGGPAAFMPYGVFCELVDQFQGMEELHLQGLGEPMLHPRFFDMVRYAAGRGVRVSTNTNLTVCTEARVRDCLDSGLAALYVSLDGASAEVFEAIRTGARFDRMLANLRRLTRMRRERAAPLHVGIVAVAMRLNLHELADIVRIAHELGVDEVSVQHLCHDFGEDSLPAHYRPMRRFVDQQTLTDEDPERVAFHFEAARRAAQALGMPLRLPAIDREPAAAARPAGSRCDWPRRGAYLSYRGEAMPCCMVATPDRVNFGNMAQAGVQAIWNGDAYEDFRRRLASDEPPEICRSCSVYAGTF
ncbi:radical SAM protein [Pigmentiphaga soli]|uniref:Radical SAM protein n=2 Tax=Pigmentiphaga soli TaxID=1007095 RepID=A0ABP8GGD1_9BURK